MSDSWAAKVWHFSPAVCQLRLFAGVNLQAAGEAQEGFLQFAVLLHAMGTVAANSET